jgi:hypothetical protein
MSNWDTHKEQHENREKWLKDNEARITELSETVIGAMDEKTLMELATEIVQSGWADHPEGFEYEWKQYQKEMGEERERLTFYDKKIWY